MKQSGTIQTISTTIHNLNLNNMQFNKLNIICGVNGAGKSLINKLVWSSSLLICIYLNGVINKSQCNKVFQLILDNTFSENDFNGETTCTFENLEIKFKLENGKITFLDIIHQEELEPTKIPIYMTKETRLFSSIVKYVNMKSILGLVIPRGSVLSEEILKLCTLYKLPDILFMESLLNNLLTPFKVTEKILQNLKECGFTFEIDTIYFEPTLKDIKFTELNSPDHKSICILSDGEQSYLNMLISTELC